MTLEQQEDPMQRDGTDRVAERLTEDAKHRKLRRLVKKAKQREPDEMYQSFALNERAPLLECQVCGAILLTDKAGLHSDWHFLTGTDEPPEETEMPL